MGYHNNLHLRNLSVLFLPEVPKRKPEDARVSALIQLAHPDGSIHRLLEYPNPDCRRVPKHLHCHHDNSLVRGFRQHQLHVRIYLGMQGADCHLLISTHDHSVHGDLSDHGQPGEASAHRAFSCCCGNILLLV